jgi:hypothetical protein
MRYMETLVVYFKNLERHKMVFYICGSVHHQSILLNNQRDVALSSRIYSSLQGYSTCFGRFMRPSSGVQLKLQIQSYVYFTMSWPNLKF